MRTRWLPLVMTALLGVWLAACGSGNPQENPQDGDTAANSDQLFTSAAGGGSHYGNNPGSAEDGSGETNADADTDKSADTDQSAGRAIAESDLYRVVGNTIFALNSYRGLAAIDFSDPANLRIVGRLRLTGEPVDMFVENGVAVIMTNGLYEEKDGLYRQTSRIYSVDVSDPAHPRLLKTTSMDGVIFDDRLVGNVAYVLSTVYPWMQMTNGTVSSSQGSVQVVSMDISDPANPHEADTLSLDRAGQAVAITSSRMYVASADYYYGNYDSQQSHIRVVDISDPHGAMTARGEFAVQGWVQDRFKMQEDNGVLAVVSNASYYWNGTNVMETFNVTDPDHVTRLGAVTLVENEQLNATRFDGRRAYIVTYYQTDPLFVADFTDAANPKILGSVQIPGWSTHLEIDGTSIYGVGVDNTDSWKVKVARFDVSDPTQPKEVKRLSLGAGYSYSEANWDWKAFKLYADRHLLLVPSTEYPSDAWWIAPTNKLNVISTADGTLTLKGAVSSDTPVRRGFVAGDYLASLSLTTLQLIRLQNDVPELAGEATLASYVGDVYDCGRALCSSNDAWYDGAVRLRLYSPEQSSDTPAWQSPALESAVSSWGSAAQIYYQAPYAFVLSARNRSWWGYAEDGVAYADTVANTDTPTSRLYAYDLSNPATPTLVGSATLDDQGDADTQAGVWSYTSLAYADRLTTGRLLAALSGTYTYDSTSSRSRYLQHFWAFDASDLASGKAPRVISMDTYTPLIDGYGRQPLVRGDHAWLATCDDYGKDKKDRPLSRCFAVRIDLSSIASSVSGTRYNVPGQLVNVSEDEKTLTTMDRQYVPGTDGSVIGCAYTLNVLRLENNHVTRVAERTLYTDNYCWYGDYPDRGLTNGSGTAQDADGGSSGATTDSGSMTCSADADCASGQACVNGLCSGDASTEGDATTCHSDADCTNGQLCVDSYCIVTHDTTDSGSMTCSVDADCASGQACMNGVCSGSGDGDTTIGDGDSASDVTTTNSYTSFAGMAMDDAAIYAGQSTVTYTYGSNGYYYYNYTYTLNMTIYDRQTGAVVKQLSVPGGSSLTAVRGGGVVVTGYDTSSGLYTPHFTYVDATGATKALPIDTGVNLSYFYLSASPVLKGRALYLPLGWEGIVKFDL